MIETEKLGTAASAAAAKEYLGAFHRIPARRRRGADYRSAVRRARAVLVQTVAGDPIAAHILSRVAIYSEGTFTDAVRLIAELPLTLDEADEFAARNGFCWVTYGHGRNAAIRAGLIEGAELTVAQWDRRRSDVAVAERAEWRRELHHRIWGVFTLLCLLAGLLLFFLGNRHGVVHQVAFVASWAGVGGGVVMFRRTRRE